MFAKRRSRAQAGSPGNSTGTKQFSAIPEPNGRNSPPSEALPAARVTQTPPSSGTWEESVRTGSAMSNNNKQAAAQLDFARTIDGKTIASGRKSDGSGKRKSDLKPRTSRLEAALKVSKGSSSFSAGSSVSMGLTSSVDSQTGSGTLHPRPSSLPVLGTSTAAPAATSTVGSTENFFKTASPNVSPSSSRRGSVTSFASFATGATGGSGGERSNLVRRGSSFLGRLMSSKSLRKLWNGDEGQGEQGNHQKTSPTGRSKSERFATGNTNGKKPTRAKTQKSKSTRSIRRRPEDTTETEDEDGEEDDYFEFGKTADGVEVLAVLRTSNLSAANGTLAPPSPHVPGGHIKGLQGGYNVNQVFIRKESSKLKAYVPKVLQEISSDAA